MAVYLIESKEDQQKLIDYVGEDTAKLFFSMKNRLKSPENDLYYWLKKDPKELEDRLNQLQNTQTRKEKDLEASEGADLIYKDDNWKVYHITTYPASVKYGKNTQWCITGSKRWSNGERGEEYFNEYTEQGIKFYFYINKNGDKYALAYSSPGYFQVFNAEDTEITHNDLTFLPDVKGLPTFSTSKGLLSRDGTYTYVGQETPPSVIANVRSVIVEDGVETIEHQAFFEALELEEIKFNKVRHISTEAFVSCVSLPKVTIPSSVEFVGSSVFDGCSLLEEVNIEDSGLPLYFGDWAFSRCTSLTEIVLPARVFWLGRGCFNACVDLETVVLPSEITELNSELFNMCISLRTVVVLGQIEEIGTDVFRNVLHATVYTDSQRLKNYCKKEDINVLSLSELK